MVLNFKTLPMFAILLLITGLTMAQSTVPAPWIYRPADTEFWQLIEGAVKDNNFGVLLSASEAQLSHVKKDSLEAAEANLAQAMGLNQMGLSFAATKILTQIITSKQGTVVAQRALKEVESILTKFPVDEEALFAEIIYDQDEAVGDGPNQDFFAYQNGLYNQLKGFDIWSEESFKKITVGSFWDYKLKYLTALNEVKKGQVDSALEKFASLSSQAAVPQTLRTEATHQYARLVFEKGDFAQAYRIFKSVELNPRERGLILLERAWSKYYQKDYAKALGLLVALEAPIFDTARSPEVYILKMLIYKELCYYEAAFAVRNEFNARFSKSIEAIKRRRDLKRDQMLVNLSALDPKVGRSVTFLNQIKQERLRLASEPVVNLSAAKFLKRAYDIKIRELYERLDFILKDKVRETADQLLDWQEQISFLDYQARVDSLRVTRPTGEVDYRSDAIPHMAFDKIYWVFAGEFWLDELESLKVQVDSRCQFSDAPKGGTP